MCLYTHLFPLYIYIIFSSLFNLCHDSFENSWTTAHKATLSMEFPRKEYWSGLPFPSPGDLPDPGIEPVYPALQADSLALSHWVSLIYIIYKCAYIYIYIYIYMCVCVCVCVCVIHNKIKCHMEMHDKYEN